MNTLNELIRYCREDHHLGALLLTGEWGCGKTHLIDQELAEALRSTHFIVRVSFLGIDSIDALNAAVRKQYLAVCTPFLGKLSKGIKSGSSFINALSKTFSILSPVQGGIASAFIAVDPLEYVPLEPVVEDHHDKKAKKKVVLVFDDLNRSQIDWGKFVGTINEYCENKGFATIVIGDLEVRQSPTKFDVMLYKLVKEKTFARTVRYIPDYPEVISQIVEKTEWPSQEYADFLTESVPLITEVFCGGTPDRKSNVRKYHNLRSLKSALYAFYRLYAFLSENQVSEISRFLYSFIVYMMISRNGISRDGEPDFEYTEEEIRQLYPEYSTDYLPESLMDWIEEGITDEDRIKKDLSRWLAHDPNEA
ncbi:MAG: hypothetical protein J6M64_12730 [Oscillospiraceae bacterium]|nr:hypothetical protein [Oscillospiraceae bacterium]